MLKLTAHEFVGEEKNIKVISRTPQIDFPEHNHDFSELVLVSSGVGSHIVNGDMINILPLTVSCISEKDYHQYYDNKALNLTNIVYKKDQLSVSHTVTDIIKRFEYDTYDLMLEESEFSHIKMLSERISVEQSNNDLHSKQMIDILFECLWIHLDRIKSRKDKYQDLIHPILYICNHYRDPELTISEVCEKFLITQKQLSLITFDVCGLSPVKFLNYLRIRNAKFLLKKGYSVMDTAMYVGFGDSNYFSTKFKKWVGYSPREFIKQ